MKQSNKKLIKTIFFDILKGGFAVVIPTVGMIAIIYFIYNFILDLISPLNYFLSKHLNLPVIFIDLFSLFIILTICFICGVLLKTKFGKFAYFVYESFLKKIKVFKIFNTIKEIYNQLTSDSSQAFKEFVIARPFGESSTGVPAFVVETYKVNEDIVYIVFAPTVPNPTSGFSYHLKENQITKYPDVPVDKAFRTILSCGVGTSSLIEEYSKR